MRRALVMIAALIAFPGHAMPSYWTGKDLFEWCEAFGERTPGKFYDAGQCRGYVSGVADIIVEKKTEAYFTTDEAGPKVNQLVDIVRAYLRDHPEKRNLSADTLVIAALKEKFPCN